MEHDIAYADRQEMIHNLSGGVKHERGATLDDRDASISDRHSGSSVPPAQSSHDTWEAIESQLDHWAEMDREYWRQRKEKEYATWLERTYGV